jgi:hypothetical protein
MGGSNSGNYGAKYRLVESCGRLSVTDLWVGRDHMARGGSSYFCFRDVLRYVSWKLIDGDTTPAISVQIDYAHPFRIELAMVRPHFGGDRWYLRCPRCRQRTVRLYLASTSYDFACRRCHRLRYRSQRMTVDARIRRRANKIVLRLGGEANDGLVYKPRGMHWSTFHRRMNEVERLNNTAFDYVVRPLLKPTSWLNRIYRN